MDNKNMSTQDMHNLIQNTNIPAKNINLNTELITTLATKFSLPKELAEQLDTYTLFKIPLSSVLRNLWLNKDFLVHKNKKYLAILHRCTMEELRSISHDRRISISFRGSNSLDIHIVLISL
ncbi:MAG TPA: hypothetical protein VEQ18_04860 [Candidatus Nitrosocosmicus sp.]|nr:hypothetical protein [Candidatus Nitrosocosmicus sp.]